MKKFLLFTAASLLLGVSAQAQKALVVDEDILNRRMANSDAEIADPSKASKAKTWQVRGDIFLEVGQGMGKYLFRTMPVREIYMLFQEDPNSTVEEEVRGVRYKRLSYPGTDIYTTMGDSVAFWKVTEHIREGAIDTALNAYERAIALDPKMARRVEENMKLAMNQLRQDADFAYQSGSMLAAATSFGSIYDHSVPPVFTRDTLAAYNAAQLFAGEQHYDEAIGYYLDCLKQGMTDDGNIHYSLYICYNAAEQPDQAAAILEEGVQKFPNNARLLESLVNLYVSQGKDPKEIIPATEAALTKDPNNTGLLYSLGVLQKNLEDYPKAEETFQKILKLDPDNFNAVFNLADLYLRQAEKARKELEDVPTNEPARRDEKTKEVDGYFRKAIPLLEQSYTARPDVGVIVQLLRSIYFRFRDESPEMQANYDKYDAVFKSLEGQQ